MSRRSGRNNHSGPDDELQPFQTIEEPARYEFQSYLSDDEEIRDNETPLIASEDTEAGPSQYGSSPEPELERHFSESPVLSKRARAKGTKSRSGTPLPNGFSSSHANGLGNGSASGGNATASVAGTTSTNELANEVDTDGENLIKMTEIEVAIDWMPPEERETFDHVEVPDYEPEHIPAGHYSPRRLRARRKTSYELDYQPPSYDAASKKRKRDEDDGDFMSNDYDDDFADEYNSGDDALGTSRQKRDIGSYFRNTRVSTRASSRLSSTDAEAQSGGTGRIMRRLRPRSERKLTLTRYSGRNDRDELQDSDERDQDLGFVQSDIVTARRKKRRKLQGRVRGSAAVSYSDVAFEKRRSSRSNRNTRMMVDHIEEDDDEIFYVEEDKPAPERKVISIREAFQPMPPAGEWKNVHRDTCETCHGGDNPNKGPLVPCQGCSVVQHKVCLGTRSSREQRVTKVGPDLFVMQCRFCLCVHRKKDERAPHQDTCQVCRAKGRSCAAFSEKKTPKQEEALRHENDGVDPITPIDARLINNPQNVLFRCVKCHQGFHFEHLPRPTSARNSATQDTVTLRKTRIQEYRKTWHCKECQEHAGKKVGSLVAWRPSVREKYTKGQTIFDFNEDDIEYLVKWEDKSYNHCVWLPGGWVYGTIAATMRNAFFKRTLGEKADGNEGDRARDSLMRWSEAEAIHESWITPDIILDVKSVPRNREDEKRYNRLPRDEKFEDDLSRVLHVTRIMVKYEGLSYNDVAWDTPPDPSSGALWEGFLDAYREYLNGLHFQVDLWRNMKERVDQFRELDFGTQIEVKEQPKGLKRGNLMAYQLEGLNWMLFNFKSSKNVILADEMGLGKTVQVVALLSSLIQDNPKVWPFLIVVPNATCANWRREIKKWAPGLRVVAYYGGRISQSYALEYELFPGRNRELKAHVVIMSYDSVKDPETKTKFNSVKWAGLVVDEAQALKNDENMLYKALKILNVPFKLLLTGTPLQNNKRELFNLLQFIDPSMDAQELDQQFEQITKENLPELHSMIRPYFLRRTKAGVLTFLPPMAQIIVPVSMSVLQAKLCKSIMERNPELIRSILRQGKLKATERGSLNNILMQLRKCLCHPFVYSQAIEDRNTTEDVMRRSLVEASSKLVLLEIMLPRLRDRGHRVLMFSQFLEQLTILEDFLEGLGIRYARLDGSLSSLEKQKKIDAFNAPNSDIFCMLLSTRAGGVGINLATADTVIILDPDWNPHQDIQALSRAHRIGQQKKVLCFQLMTVDSAEEKILQIGRKKMALDHLLIESMDGKEGEALNDVESVLKHGAAALFGEGEKKASIVYDSAAVDKLLDRSVQEETRQDGEKSAESAFAFARVWAQDKGGEFADEMQVANDEINVGAWDEILRQREEEARQEAERTKEVLGRGGRRRGATNYTAQRFDFEQELPAESDQESVDEDFVGGGDESDTESDENPDTPVSRASTIDIAQHRALTQGKGKASPSLGNSRKAARSARTPDKATPKAAIATVSTPQRVTKSRSSSQVPKTPTRRSPRAPRTPRTPRSPRTQPIPSTPTQTRVVIRGRTRSQSVTLSSQGNGQMSEDLSMANSQGQQYPLFSGSSLGSNQDRQVINQGQQLVNQMDNQMASQPTSHHNVHDQQTHDPDRMEVDHANLN